MAPGQISPENIARIKAETAALTGKLEKLERDIDTLAIQSYSLMTPRQVDEWDSIEDLADVGDCIGNIKGFLEAAIQQCQQARKCIYKAQEKVTEYPTKWKVISNYVGSRIIYQACRQTRALRSGEPEHSGVLEIKGVKQNREDAERLVAELNGGM